MQAATLAMAGLLLTTAVIPLACSPFGGVNQASCAQDSDCQGAGAGQNGRCELSTGFCAFEDATCGPLGRYGDLAGGLSGTCVEGGPGDDADVPDPDGPPPDPDDVCLGGAGAIIDPCWDPAELPNTPVTLAATAVIDTDNSPMCSTTVKNVANVCVIAGSTVTIAGGVTIRATGALPLVIVATTGAVQIDGTLDLASRVATPADLPAAANDGGCDAGTLPGASAGGAGGSHGALGGNGGNRAANSAGVAGAATGALATLRGGCPGQPGDDGNAGTAGARGNSGGAVAVIGKTAINLGVTGQINASGAGATGGNLQQASGGGGGSGGTIVLDTPTLANGGEIFAHGGGGGAGAGNGSQGGAGGDPTFLAGGTAGLPAGQGSAGGPGATGAAGSPGINSSDRGAGGGGGGTGIVKLFGGATANGSLSPTPQP